MYRCLRFTYLETIRWAFQAEALAGGKVGKHEEVKGKCLLESRGEGWDASVYKEAKNNARNLETQSNKGGV